MIQIFYFITILMFFLYIANVLVGAFDLSFPHVGAIGEFLLLFIATISLSILCLFLEKRHYDSQQK